MNRTRPTVGVVIPTWKASGRIRSCLRMLSRSSRKPDEIIIVVDGPRDGTEVEANLGLHEFGLPGQVLTLSENLGPSAARNLGWRSAKSNWIQFLDDDDEIHEEKLKWQTTDLNENDDRKIAIVHSPWIDTRIRDGEFVSESVEAPRVQDGRLVDRMCYLLQPDVFIPFGSALISREWLKMAGGFAERVRLIEDVELQIRLLGMDATFRALPVPAPVFRYVRRSGSLSHQRNIELSLANIRNVNLAIELSRKRGDDIEVLNDTLWAAYERAIPLAAENNPISLNSLISEAGKHFPGRRRTSGWALQVLLAIFSWNIAERIAAGTRSARRSVLRARRIKPLENSLVLEDRIHIKGREK